MFVFFYNTMKEAYYFRHDCNARRDQKIIALRLKYKMEGYGIFWSIIELLRESADYMCIRDYNIVAFDLHVSVSVVKSVIEDFGLFKFTEDGKFFYSERLLKDMQSKDGLSAIRSEAGKKGMACRYGKKNEDLTPLQQSYNKVITNENDVITIRKENIKEEKNSTIVEQKKDNRPAFVPPTEEEVLAYAQSMAYAHFDAARFVDFYISKNWYVGKNKMKDWKAAVRNWCRSNQERAGKTQSTNAAIQAQNNDINSEWGR